MPCVGDEEDKDGAEGLCWICFEPSNGQYTDLTTYLRNVLDSKRDDVAEAGDDTAGETCLDFRNPMLLGACACRGSVHARCLARWLVVNRNKDVCGYCKRGTPEWKGSRLRPCGLLVWAKPKPKWLQAAAHAETLRHATSEPLMVDPQLSTSPPRGDGDSLAPGDEPKIPERARGQTLAAMSGNDQSYSAPSSLGHGGVAPLPRSISLGDMLDPRSGSRRHAQLSPSWSQLSPSRSQLSPSQSQWLPGHEVGQGGHGSHHGGQAPPWLGILGGTGAAPAPGAMAGLGVGEETAPSDPWEPVLEPQGELPIKGPHGLSLATLAEDGWKPPRTYVDVLCDPPRSAVEEVLHRTRSW
eukprot:jgi/Mesvir1/1063/Mv17582-RA.1